VITIDLDRTVDLSMPQTRQALLDAAELMRAAWIKMAREQLGSESGAYIQGLQDASAIEYPLDGDELAIGVTNSAPHAGPIERGFAPFNLADRIKEWKYTTGKPHTRVPFRHGAPASPGSGSRPGRRDEMSPKIHAVAKQLRRGEMLQPPEVGHQRRITGWVKDGRGRGAGNVIGRREVGPRGGRYLVAHGVSGNQRNMMKFGGGGQSQYLTFRTITPESNWIIPGRPGKHFTEQVEQLVGDDVRRILAEAFAKDAQRIVDQAYGGAG